MPSNEIMTRVKTLFPMVILEPIRQTIDSLPSNKLSE